MLMRLFIVDCAALAFWPAGVEGQKPQRHRAALQALPATDSSWWPLAVGNSWTYAAATPFFDREATVRVTASETHASRVYFRVESPFHGDALLRSTARGRVFALDPESGVERLWYDFSTPEGGGWPDETNDCTGAPTVAARSGSLATPAGTFKKTLRVAYGPSPCADAGVGEEVFALGTGLLRRSETTIAGPVIYVLQSARIAGRLVIAPGVAFGLQVNQARFTPNLMPQVDPQSSVPQLRATLVLENTSDQPLTLHFDSGQQFDLELRDSRGETVFLWSVGRMFTEALTSIELSPGTKTFTIETPLGDADSGEPLPAGEYLVEAWLTTRGGKRYAAMVPIEVTEPAF